MMLRIGIGYDAHPLKVGRKLILGGVEIPFEKGLSGHSDADIVCHAIMDAILGALAEGDMGKHFPDSDPKFKNASSLELLKKVNQILRNKRGRVSNIDLTIIAEKPKLADFINAIRENLKQALDVSMGAISIKCSTNNGLGFIGRGEGMACMAVCLVESEE